jgi:hypothetical protein
MAITQRDLDELRKQGYSDEVIREALREVEQEELNASYNQTQIQRQTDPRRNSQLSSFATKSDENIVRWQLELNDILERAEHILKGDVPKFQDGFVIWEKNPNEEDNALNEKGVHAVMKVLSLYVNRNTILADYTNDEINHHVFDFGRELNNLIFMKDEDFGMNTDEKRKDYAILVLELKDIVHSAYKRALNGAEKRSLREMITVSQNTNTNAQIGGGVVTNQQGMPVKERGMLNPMRYIRGKYV